MKASHWFFVIWYKMKGCDNSPHTYKPQEEVYSYIFLVLLPPPLLFLYLDIWRCSVYIIPDQAEQDE